MAKPLYTEVINGVTYERFADGHYEPPLPPEEVAKRASRASLFSREVQRGQVARGMTDDVFWGGRKHFSEVYGEDYASDVRQRLSAQGVHMTAHDEYLPELAQYRGDPRAVVNRSEGRGYIARRAEELGVGCEGAVKASGSQPIADPMEDAPALAEDLVQEAMAEHIAVDPSRSENLPELREEVIDKHGSKP